MSKIHKRQKGPRRKLKYPFALPPPPHPRPHLRTRRHTKIGKSLDGSAILLTTHFLMRTFCWTWTFRLFGLDSDTFALRAFRWGGCEELAWISSTDNKTICSSRHSMCADNDIKSAFCLLVGTKDWGLCGGWRKERPKENTQLDGFSPSLYVFIMRSSMWLKRD